MTRRRLTWLLTLLLVAGVAALWQVALRRLDFFAVRSVEVHGLRNLDERVFVEALALPEDADMALDLDPVAERARGFAGIRDARVTRRLPGTLVVRVREAPAVAVATRDGRVVVLDDRATILPVDPARLAMPLPVADADSGVTSLLARVLEADPHWFGKVDRVAREGKEVVLHTEEGSVRLPLGAGTRTVVELAAVRSWLERGEVGWETIDARFAGRMFVRRDS